MIRIFKHAVRRFKGEEKGQMLVEFVLVIPLVFTIFMTSVEMGIYQMRQMFLDRGLDLAVRTVRLSPGAPRLTHTQLKLMICDFAGFLDDCDSQLKLEMSTVDLRGFTGFQTAADCTDAAQPIAAPPVNYNNDGASNQMMLMRACYKFKPVFASSGLGYEFSNNGDGVGMAKMVSLTAFVQEPQR